MTNCIKWLVSSTILVLSVAAQADNVIDVQGRWIKDQQGHVMPDPQPSGLTSWRGSLLTLADRSADLSQQLKFSQISVPGSILQPQHFPFILGSAVLKSCFAKYLGTTPDLEALTVDPDNDRVFYTITEDARYSPLSAECAKQWAGSGSTEFPTLLVRLELVDDNYILVTHVRPLQFKAEFKVGNFPNDGFEGMAFGSDRSLYLALEKDMASQARIFRVKMSDDFWQQSGFVTVEDPQLRLPVFNDGEHPLNGMDYYPGPVEEHPGFLLAIARNKDQLWVIDLSRQAPGKIIQLAFWAEVQDPPAECKDWELMDNASVEGVAVIDDIVWMINDPWKVNYPNNIQCEVNRPYYEKMAPLLFALPINPQWFSE